MRGESGGRSPESMVIALLRAGRGRHAGDHRPFAHAAQLLNDDAGSSVGVTTTRARKCKLSVGTARRIIGVQRYFS